MKKKLKRAGAALAALALCAAMMPAAFAATEPVVSWDFNDGSVSSWAGDAGWSNDNAPNVAAEEDMLKLTATFAEGDSTWKQNAWVQLYTEAQNFIEVCEVTYDLYAPSSITHAGIVVAGASTYYQPVSYLGNLTGTEVNIGGTTYTKYNLAFTLDGSAAAQDTSKTVADVLADMTAIRIFLAGGANASGEISCYVDNISLNKEAASEEPVGDYLYYNAGPVEMPLPSSSSQWPYTTVTIDPAVTVYPGAVVEYDVTLENNSFTKFYTEPKFNWTGIANMTVTPSNLIDNGDGTYSFHFSGTYDVYGGTAATTIEVKTLRIQFQNEFNDNGIDKGIGYDYEGEVKVTDIKVTNGKAPVTETTAPATPITGTFEDGSQGWTVEVDASALTSGAQWVITNSDNETAEFDAVIEPSVDGNVRIGLVLTQTAIGDSTITGVSLKY